MDHLRIDRLRIRPYDLPLRRDWHSARGGFQRRRGWLVCAETDGAVGFGDCAPIPAAGTEDHESAKSALSAAQACASGRSVGEFLQILDDRFAVTPAARFALECALLDLLSQVEGVPLRRLLARDASNEVPVNGILGALATLTAADLQQAAEAGFRVVKIKVGVEDSTSEIARLTALARFVPTGMRLRLDANGAWDDDEACRILDGLSELPIESLEEPLRIPDPSRLRALQERAGFPLARDESLAGRAADVDLGGLGVRRIVIKPAVVGGLRSALDLSRRAATAGVEVVVTSVVESAAGLWPTAQLAAATGSRLPHGLATADWLAEDLGVPPRLNGAYLLLSDQPGSGFKPHADPPPNPE
ncbi:o-succinylbenzoate synthase [Thiocapsa rosea]|uniref:o-succinylbenzoate synthase n=1 Tax=Thiocapsa rosea TaxID=69360 RepID=A0A495V7C5_9GAMM|nr:o-succinylbenzoate synthase [Thiocapsa rosea]RKT44610.1 o-succinylbenzoate synthase [Thiocapsa rosea]